MRISEILETAGVGRVIPGVNMPKGMHPDEVRRQAAKFGNLVTKDGVPPVARTDGKDAVREEVWDEPGPKKKGKKLTPAQKSAAKARAKRAGRPYPNLIDNMWASKRS